MHIRTSELAAPLFLLCLLASLAGCSFGLLSSPERPLSKKDMTARALTRDVTTRFRETTARSTDNILRSETDPAVINNTLRWEVGVIVTSRDAETQLAPMMALLDTWALALQLQAFVAEDGPGGALFGTHQAAVREITANYADDVQRLAHSLLSSKEFTNYQSFISDYVHAHPLQDLRFARVSVLGEWARVKGTESSLLDEVGTIPQALANTTQLVQIYGDTVPLQSMRRTQLAMRESGYTPEEMRAALARLDARLERLTAVAESSPELVRGAEEEVRESLREIMNRLDASVTASAAAFHSEREALFADLHEEREALTAAVDVQRKALTADAGRM